jgi:bacillithiol system protein YtxJ
MIVELRQDRDLEQLLEWSKTNPVLIFKHSTQCPVSARSYEEFVTFAEASDDVACGVVLVIENRELSNMIEQRLNVRHESPQAIIVTGGRATWHASHWSITADSLSEAVAERKRARSVSAKRETSSDTSQPQQVNSNGEPAHQRD